MIGLDSAINEGVGSGLVIGFYEKAGIVPPEARRILADPTSALTSMQRGYRKGLLKVGLLERRWFTYRITDAGHRALSEQSNG